MTIGFGVATANEWPKSTQTLDLQILGTPLQCRSIAGNSTLGILITVYRKLQRRVHSNIFVLHLLFTIKKEVVRILKYIATGINNNESAAAVPQLSLAHLLDVSLRACSLL